MEYLPFEFIISNDDWPPRVKIIGFFCAVCIQELQQIIGVRVVMVYDEDSEWIVIWGWHYRQAQSSTKIICNDLVCIKGPLAVLICRDFWECFCVEYITKSLPNRPGPTNVHWFLLQKYHGRSQSRNESQISASKDEIDSPSPYQLRGYAAFFHTIMYWCLHRTVVVDINHESKPRRLIIRFMHGLIVN